jgi:hypothetical protein
MTASLAGRVAAPAVFVALLFAVSALAETAGPSAPPAPANSAAAAPGGSAAPQTNPSASASSAPATSAASATLPDTNPPPAAAPPATAPIATAPAPPATAPPPVAPQPAYPPGPPAPPFADAGRAQKFHAPPMAYATAGGVLSQGLDTTDRATRQGGFYLGGEYVIDKIVPIDAEYAFASGDVTERLPGSSFGAFGVPNDVRQLQSRHAFDVTAGYLWRITQGRERVYAVPYLGPRALFLVDPVSPEWAMEAEFGARVGVWSGNDIGADAFLAFAPAFARTSAPASVYGKIASELRFGAGFTLHPGDSALGARVAYEGDVVSLQHEKLTYHQLLAGLVYSFE